MKNLHIDMINEHWQGDPNDYLKMRIKRDKLDKSEILCPNCMVDNLLLTDEKDILICVECGYDFIKLDNNTVKFK